MNWQSASEFLAMGGYGLYVWGSYAVTLIVLIGEIVALVMPARRNRAPGKILRGAQE